MAFTAPITEADPTIREMAARVARFDVAVAVTGFSAAL